MVRLQVEKDMALSILGAARTSAAALAGVWLEDNYGEKWFPIGYVLLKADKTQRINIDVNNVIRSSKQIPFWDMGAKDEMYLYFPVRKGIVITSYHVGNATEQRVNLPVPE